MTRGQEKMLEDKRERDLKDKDISQREKESKRKFASDIISSVAKGSGTAIAKGLLNDPAWYKAWINDKDFTGIPPVANTVVQKLQIMGYRISVGNTTPNPFNNNSTPVVVGLRYLPRLGRARGTNSIVVNASEFPANTGWMKDLAQIAKVNSRAVSQDPDVMGLYVLQVIEIARALAYIRTNLQIVSKFSANQFQVREALLRARGVSVISDYIDNYAEWVKLYETYSKRFNEEIVLPSEMPLLKRRVWLDSVVLRDHSYHKSQYITFNSMYFGTWDASNSWVEYNYDLGAQIVSLARNRLDMWFSLVTSDVDFQTLIGNMRAAIPQKSMAQLPLDIGELQITEADVNAMHQFRNIVTLPEDAWVNASVASKNAFCQIVSDGTYLTQGSHLEVSTLRQSTLPALAAIGHMDQDQIFHFYSDELSSDLVLEATRLHPYFGFNVTRGNDSAGDSAFTTYVMTVVTEGTEIVTEAKVYMYSKTSGIYTSSTIYSYVSGLSATIVSANVDTHIATAATHLRDACLLTNFDWSFDVYYATDISAAGSSQNDYVSVIRLNGEIANYAEISKVVLSDINDIATRSEYFIPDTVFSREHIR